MWVPSVVGWLRGSPRLGPTGGLAASRSAKDESVESSQGTPGVIVEHGDTGAMFQSPRDPRTSDHVHGRFG